MGNSPVAVISDIHGNLEALQAVLHFLDERGIGKIVCLGDLVGYGPNPNEVVELIRERKIPCCLGNHDAAVIGKTSVAFFNEWAREAVFWTSGILNPDSRAYLLTLPLRIHEEDCLFVHASPSRPMEWRYLMSALDAEDEFPFFDERICFVGHSHHPVIFPEKGYAVIEQKFHLVDGERYIINVGSVGQPRDNDPRAAVCILDAEKKVVSYERIGYDVEKVKWKIIQAGLPEYLALRLVRGK